jgi:aerobic carbon-monoxide dehydrogenase large subunit
MTTEHATGPFVGARWFGTPVKRREDPKLMTGSAAFLDDIHVPNTLHLAFVRSPYAHARIGSIDASAAKAMPGVIDVITGDETAAWAPPFPPDAGPKQPPRYVLARDKVRKVGEAVAVVVAEDRYLAADAADAVEVEYDPLAAVSDPEAAISPDAEQIWDEFAGNTIVRDVVSGGGDVDAAFAAADVIIRQRMDCPRLAPSAIETRGVLATFQPWDGTLSVWLTTQAPHRARLMLSRMTGLAESRIRVVAPEVGGGFGAKGGVAYPEEALACLLAMRLQRSIKWVESRSEAFTGTLHGRGQIGYIELAARRDGTLLGLKLRLIADMGHNGGSAIPQGQTVRLVNNVYRLGAVQVSLTEAITNRPLTGPYRGAGRPEAVYFTERAMDLLARELQMDPLELRRINLIPAGAFPYTTATGLVYDSGDYAGALDALLKQADYAARVRERDALRADGRLAGIGVSLFVENASTPPANQGGGPIAWENAAVRVDQTGSISVLAGTSAHGQGHETVYTQLACEVLGVAPETVTVLQRDTALVSQGVGTFGSRSMVMGGSALYLALREVEAKMRRIAGRMLEANEDDLRFRDSRIEPIDAPDRGLPFAQVATRAYMLPDPGEDPGLEAHRFYASQGSTFPYGAYLCMVEIDRETGKIDILRFDGIDDCGPIINPLLARGQVHGGIAQGIGQALMEQVVYDEDAQLVSGSFMDYAMPLAETFHGMTIGHTVTPSPNTPLGVKGVGESGTVGATPAVGNAVMDALAPLGIRHIDIPLTPLKVWQAIQAAEGAA